MLNIALNGFGRIGKNFLRIIMADKSALEKLSIKAINIGPADIAAIAHSFTYDTLMGTYQFPVSLKDNILEITDHFGKKHQIQVLGQLDPANLPWSKFDIDWVVEATGKFTKRDGAQKHLTAGAKKVLITAPAHGEDVTIIPGVNFEKYNAQKDAIVSLGSCTTNALVPLLYFVEKTYGIEQAAMTTVHAYTNTQALLDVDATTKDLRRSRAAALNIVPTTTGAMEVIGRIMPSLAGKITGCSLRVPVPTVSLIDLMCIVKKPVTQDELNKACESASTSYLKNIMAVSQVPLVSSDYAQNTHSVIVDAPMTQTMGNMIKLFGWYDNEWGYSSRLKDFLVLV